jgi:hypothetical protein
MLLCTGGVKISLLFPPRLQYSLPAYSMIIRGVQLIFFIEMQLSCISLVPFILANDNSCHYHVLIPIIQLLIEPPLLSFLY